MTQQEKEIIRSYAGGTPVEEIAEVEGVTVEQITAIIEHWTPYGQLQHKLSSKALERKGEKI